MPLQNTEDLVRESERINLARLRVRGESESVALAIEDWANKIGRELVAVLEKHGPDLPPQEAARFLRLLVLRSLLLNHEQVNATGKGLESLREILFPAEHGSLKKEPTPELASGLDVSI